MRLPKWFKERVAVEAGRVLDRTITEDDATKQIAKLVRDDHPDFAASVLLDFVRKQIKTVGGQHRRDLYADGGGGSQLDLFPEIPRRLETSPGRFADQAVMTGPDWDNALKQAKTKADNASGYFDGIKQVYDRVRPLLTDDELTTAEVWRPGGQLLAVAGA